eukprot:EG_transcript_22730
MRFGDCSGITECNWGTYIPKLLWNGQPGFIVAACLLVCAAIYAFTLCSCCRNRLLSYEAAVQHPRALVTVPLLLTVAVACSLGAAGLTLVVLGWLDVFTAYSRAWELFDTLIAALQRGGLDAEALVAGLQRQLAGLQAALADAQGVLGPAGGALGAMTAQFFGLLQVADLLEGVLSLAENVDQTRDILDFMMGLYKWVVLPVACCATAALALNAAAGVLRSRRTVFFILMFLGFVATVACWLTLAATLIVKAAIVDGCGDLHNLNLQDLLGSL